MEKPIVDSATKAHLERAVEHLNKGAKGQCCFLLHHTDAGWELAAKARSMREFITVAGPLSKPDLYLWMKGYAKGLTWAREFLK
jgi:hypothetical protein